MNSDNQSVPIQPVFSAFLAEPIGQETNGMQLSLLSALTRLGVDPWEEASRLAQMPQVAAAKALVAMLTRLPAGDWSQGDCVVFADRLVLKLPSRSSVRNVEGGDGQARIPQRLVWPALMGLLLVVLWIAWAPG